MSDATRSSAPAHESLSPLGVLAFSAAFWPYLAVSSAALFIPALGIWAATAPFDKDRRLLRRFTEEWAAHYLERAPYAGVTVIGRDRIPDGPAIYVANHQSMCDVLALMSARLPALWVSKIENFYAPFLGWNMALNGYVAVKRGYQPSIMKMMRRCISLLGAGRSLIVFPEGTRSEDGQLRSFYRGAFFLSTRTKVPIVPVCMFGTREILRKGSAAVRPQQVTVRIHEAIDPSIVDGDSRRLRDHVRSLMGSELERMRDAAART